MPSNESEIEHSQPNEMPAYIDLSSDSQRPLYAEDLYNYMRRIFVLLLIMQSFQIVIGAILGSQIKFYDELAG